MPGYKIASADLINLPLQKEIAKTGKPIILSTGGGNFKDIDRAVKNILKINKNLTVLHCTASYPADYKDMNLLVVKKLKQKYPNLKAIQINTIIETFINTLTEGLKNKRSIEIRSFGTFFIKEIKEKKSARNPKTGEIIYIPKKNKVRFRASKDLKEYINQIL